jgi:hypothetical protein
MKRLALLIASATIACGSVDDTEIFETYDTAEAALAAHAVERGVLPAWIPKTAMDVRIYADLDLGHSWARFSLRDGFDVARVPEVESSDRSVIENTPGIDARRIPWWSSCLDPAAAPCETGFRYFVVRSREHPDSYIAEDVSEKMIYWWYK